MFNCLKCGSPPSDASCGSLTLGCAVLNLYVHCKACCSLWGITSLPTYALLLYLAGLDFNQFSPQSKFRGRHTMTPSGSVPLGRSDWFRDGHTIEARPDPDFCQSYQETSFLCLWNYDLLGPWKLLVAAWGACLYARMKPTQRKVELRWKVLW